VQGTRGLLDPRGSRLPEARRKRQDDSGTDEIGGREPQNDPGRSCPIFSWHFLCLCGEISELALRTMELRRGGLRDVVSDGPRMASRQFRCSYGGMQRATSQLVASPPGVPGPGPAPGYFRAPCRAAARRVRPGGRSAQGPEQTHRRTHARSRGTAHPSERISPSNPSGCAPAGAELSNNLLSLKSRFLSWLP